LRRRGAAAGERDEQSIDAGFAIESRFIDFSGG